VHPTKGINKTNKNHPHEALPAEKTPLWCRFRASWSLAPEIISGPAASANELPVGYSERESFKIKKGSSVSAQKVNLKPRKPSACNWGRPVDRPECFWVFFFFFFCLPRRPASDGSKKVAAKRSNG